MKNMIKLSSSISLPIKNIFICMLPMLFLIQGCKKDNPPAPEPENENLVLTIIDNQTHTPLDSAYVNITYGNTYSTSGFTGTDGKFIFDIPDGWVLNDISVTKAGYCNYLYSHNTTSYDHTQTIYIDHYAYLRYHVKNLTPAAGSDKLVIYSPNPISPIGFELEFYGASVDSTFVIVSSAGNLGISCNIFTGSTFISSFYTYATAIGGDTIDVTVDY